MSVDQIQNFQMGCKIMCLIYVKYLLKLLVNNNFIGRNKNRGRELYCNKFLNKLFNYIGSNRLQLTEIICI